MQASRKVDFDPKRSVFDALAVSGGTPAKATPYQREKRYDESELDELREALDQGSLFFAHGKKVKSLEAEFAAYVGAKHAVATSSGTATIHAAMIALGISPGDEVIVPPITDMGSIVPILWQGAIPVFADLDPHTYNLDPASVKANLSAKTRAILAVHLTGNACDLESLQSITKGRDIRIIEDCAQAHGCEYQGKRVGTFGEVGCYSFNEFKHISCGDGGVLVTNDGALAARARLAIDKCYSRDATALVRSPTFLANNYRMTELQGAVARAQLRKLDSIVTRRRSWCASLSNQLAGTPGLSLPEIAAGCNPTWWFYLMRVDTLVLTATFDEVCAALRAEGLPVGAHYIGTPIYQYPLFEEHTAFEHAAHAFASRKYAKGLCPVAESILDTCIMLPINEAYSATDLDQTVLAIKKVFQHFAHVRV
jgi:perosamine synthetase